MSRGIPVVTVVAVTTMLWRTVAAVARVAPLTAVAELSVCPCDVSSSHTCRSQVSCHTSHPILVLFVLCELVFSHNTVRACRCRRNWQEESRSPCVAWGLRGGSAASCRSAELSAERSAMPRVVTPCNRGCGVSCSVACRPSPPRGRDLADAASLPDGAVCTSCALGEACDAMRASGAPGVCPFGCVEPAAFAGGGV